MQDQVEMVRGIIRKDLDSVGMVPTGVGIQLIASQDQSKATALILEAIYVQIFNDRNLSSLRSYLLGPMQLDEEGIDYFIRSAFRVRNALASSKGNGKIALDDLMRDKGAEIDLMKLLLTTCFNVSKEYKIPFERLLEVEKEYKEWASVPDGEIVNDSYSTCAPHVKASFLRILKYDKEVRGAVKAAIILILVVLIFSTISVILFLNNRYIWGSVAALPVIFFAKTAITIALMFPLMIRRMKQMYFSALLTAGVIVNVKPIRIACFVNIGNGEGPEFYGLKVIEVDELPGHNIRLDEHIPCVSMFESGDKPFRWDNFTPRPISWGTSSSDEIQRCEKKILKDDFHNAKKAYKSGKYSKNIDDLVVLNDKFEIDNS